MEPASTYQSLLGFQPSKWGCRSSPSRVDWGSVRLNFQDLWTYFRTFVPRPGRGRYPWPIPWSAPPWARSSGSQPSLLPGSKGRIRGFSIGYLRCLGRCRTEDPSLGEGLQLQRLQQQMWQERPKPESITGGGKFIIYLHPLTAENEMWVFQGTASLSVGPCLVVTHVLGSVRGDNCTRDNSIILHNTWLWNEIPKIHVNWKVSTAGDRRRRAVKILPIISWCTVSSLAASSSWWILCFLVFRQPTSWFRKLPQHNISGLSRHNNTL